MRIRGQDVGYDSGLVQPTRRVGPCARSARPRPCLRTFGQPRLHRIPLGEVGQAIAVCGLPSESTRQATQNDRPPHRQSEQYWLQPPSVPHPAVKRLVLPKRLSGASQDQVRAMHAPRKEQGCTVGLPMGELAPIVPFLEAHPRSLLKKAMESVTRRRNRLRHLAESVACRMRWGRPSACQGLFQQASRKCRRGRYVVQILLLRRKQTADPAGRRDKTGVISHVAARTKCTNSKV